MQNQQYQQDYRKFLFYATKQNIIYSNKIIDTRYIQGIKQFVNLTPQQCYQFTNLVTILARKYNFLQIGNFQYSGNIDWSPLLPPTKNFNDRSFDTQAIFPIVHAIEFHINKQKKSIQNKQQWFSLSKQQIIDCCQDCLKTNDQYALDAVYSYIQENGLVQQKYYPYQNSISNPKPKNCRIDKILDEKNNTVRRYKIDKYEIKLTQGKCKYVNKWLEKGPVVVAVDGRNWRMYNYGRFNNCQRKLTNYALLVGKGIGYWKIKNSWGNKWGEKGYIRLQIEQSQDVCGLCLRGSVPIKGNWYN